MIDKLKEWSPLVVALVVVVSGLLLARKCQSPDVVEVKTTDTVTVTVIDTVVIEEPPPVRVVEKRTDTITVYRGTDTLYVPVPIRRYSFRDSLYALDVSGFNVTLDRLEVYPRTVYKTITNTTERTVTDKKRWGIGVQAGYGYDFGTGKFTPYVGVGINYSIIRF